MTTQTVDIGFYWLSELKKGETFHPKFRRVSVLAHNAGKKKYAEKEIQILEYLCGYLEERMEVLGPDKTANPLTDCLAAEFTLPDYTDTVTTYICGRCEKVAVEAKANHRYTVSAECPECHHRVFIRQVFQ